MPFQIGACHTSPVMARNRVKRAAALTAGRYPGYSARLVGAFRCAEVINYLKVLAEEAAPVGLVLYNPPHAKKAVDARGVSSS